MRSKKCVVIQSKVDEETARKLEELAEKYGFPSRYALLQSIISNFLRWADPEMNAKEQDSEEDKLLYEFARLFEGFENAKSRVITTKPGGNRALRLTDSINIYSELGRQGYVCKKISVDGEDIHTTGSSEKALSTVLRKLFPRMDETLRKIGEELGERSVMAVIDYLTNDELVNNRGLERNEIQEAFDRHRGDIQYGIVPQRRRKRSVNDE